MCAERYNEYTFECNDEDDQSNGKYNVFLPLLQLLQLLLMLNIVDYLI